MADLKDKQKDELKLWRRWQSGDTDALGPLMKSYQPLVHQWMQKLQASPLPQIFIEMEVKKQVLDSFQSYDPKRGTQLNTYVTSRLPKVLRNTVYQYGNLGRIPEERQRQIFTFQSAKDRLSEQKGRPATAMELASDLSWSLQEVERMEKELRPKKLMTEDGDFSFQSDDTEQKALQLVYHSLGGPQQLLFEHHFGWAGKPKLKDGDMAKKMKVDLPGLKKMKTDLAGKLEQALKVTG
jgi:DNA-directed RNA polymerase specialized sigma subunit